jgi:hypothetical protein
VRSIKKRLGRFEVFIWHFGRSRVKLEGWLIEVTQWDRTLRFFGIFTFFARNESAPPSPGGGRRKCIYIRRIFCLFFCFVYFVYMFLSRQSIFHLRSKMEIYFNFEHTLRTKIEISMEDVVLYMQWLTFVVYFETMICEGITM